MQDSEREQHAGMRRQGRTVSPPEQEIPAAPQKPTRPTRWQAIRTIYRESLLPLLHMPATWVFAACWLGGVAMLVFSGQSALVFANVLPIAIVLILTLLSLPITAGQRPPTRVQAASARARRTLWAQVAISLAILVFVFCMSLVHYHVLPSNLVVLAPLASFLFGSLEAFGQAPTLANLWIPVLYFVVPMAAMLLLGVRFREVGFDRGYRSWSVILLWSVVPAVLIVLSLAGGSKSLLVLFYLIIQNNLRNGFFEEFFARGLLLTRLKLLVGTPWAVVLSTLAFGLWHTAGYTASAGGNVVVGIGMTLFGYPTVVGLCMAVLFLRTRNLLAGSLIHALLDITGQVVS